MVVVIVSLMQVYSGGNTCIKQTSTGIYNGTSDDPLNISIYYIQGRLINELENNYKNAGPHTIT